MLKTLDTRKVNGMDVVHDVIREMISPTGRPIGMGDMSIKHAHQTARGTMQIGGEGKPVTTMEGEIAKSTDVTNSRHQVDGEDNAIDSDFQNTHPVKMPEQGEELEAIQLCKTNSEKEAPSTNYWEALSTLVMSLSQHEYGTIFPQMLEKEFNDLVDDIRENGFREEEKFVMYEGKVLDGWHR